ncbi:hypothetical protein A3B05_01865 [Candidatus Giovannonibacteria bacterium RIFCSPLOWO2_01_FULL_43_160]|uniref:Uncharacterized protein n=2 Tax=Candidatus Giovannoniibacteriota TaxID=1752738 RepID=A0A1F5XUX0_9BACT|nr:MAG: hypothetical protein A2652_01815 [Candidatus Giovannonibacteria bacterium RIFCSPHIGHO2_01_FULL_43_140]OGF72060.1 MAG: hypothetical protein A3E35_03695 [Candidatus Giovannonibacteria bacterium RIFCSPHIGHO2_12_FULL_44_22]OGF75372.1 MAG: hypothetical protein A3B05_01865 [Candidatus Giovannonibacteria bacterium RIFCSPLOWO2_01_FULL_43_160]OGF85783.1 MAG: hypothetical protein A3I28_01055 [Candidatus Giovannonibacteria bacterium RIFCSPLOWO2_02_FULL_43_37]OGF91696.1 MAG: hypothetical protein A3
MNFSGTPGYGLGWQDSGEYLKILSKKTKSWYGMLGNIKVSNTIQPREHSKGGGIGGMAHKTTSRGERELE